MRGRLFDRRLRVSALGVVLCLLAAVFAIEAKVAWYSPSGSPSAQISAAKLQPTESQREVAHALAAPSTVQHLSSVAPLLFFFFANIIAPAASFHWPVRDQDSPHSSATFSLPLFRRPPPRS